ncbi:MAG TPA: carboxypeptidase-like regulatory domain-containing protein [Solirubrobacteraceae bacterium]|nr:carboxypeptidase-like regulatory domain-containing protein [Solirubrobacteraceae bacterium]
MLLLMCAILVACIAAGAPAATAVGTGAVTGTVKDAAKEAPIAEIGVCARAASEPLATPTCATTSATGEYEIAGLAEGQYHVWFSVPANSTVNYATQYFQARSTEALADPVTVTEGTATPNVNALMQAGGEIKGSVSEGKGNSLGGIQVCALEKGAEAPPVRCVLTKATGNYTIAALSSGEYEVEFSSSPGSEPSYVTQFYKGAATRAAATAVTVTAGGAAVKNVSAVLEPVAPPPPPTGTISGTVTSATTSAPLANAHVCAVNIATALETCTASDASGTYALAELAPGEYDVEFVAAEGGEAYEPQWYKEKSSKAEAEAVKVTSGANTEAVDAKLQPTPPPPPPTGTISGTVTSATTSAPLANIRVCAVSLATAVETCILTDASGAYALPELAPGDYHVDFVAAEGGEAYESQWYKEKKAEVEAEAVTVTAGESTSAIDAKLKLVVAEGEEPEPEEPEPGNNAPVSLTRPSISGTTQQGQTLVFTSGTWLFEPTLITDEWGLCANTGVIETCHTIAESPSYTLTATDVGGTIRIREKAFNAFGEGQAFSRPTTVIAGPPAIPQTASTAASPSPTASSGVSSEIAHAASAAQLKALLTKLLVPGGTSAKLTTLGAHGSYTATFSSLAAGRISIAWYFVPKGAHVAKSKPKPKPVLVAAGKLTTKEGGTAKLTIKLTSAGHALVAKHKPLKLTAQGAFAPKGRATLNATRSFTLKR